MIDIFHVLDQPGVDIQTYVGTASVTLTQWQTWRKPKGCKWVYMFAVGGGSSGGCGVNTGTTSGGGSGGCSGAQSALLIPAIFVPDVLYIQAGQGGKQPAVLVSGAVSVVGVISIVAAEPYTSTNTFLTFLQASAGPAGVAAATTTTGGTATTAAAVMTLSTVNLAGRGFTNFLAGQAGVSGGSSTAAGTQVTYPTTGLLVSGGGGGGGTDNVTPRAGGGIGITNSGLGQGFVPSIISGGTAASGATPAGSGYHYMSLMPMIFTGGSGGGSCSGTAGGVAGAGANGAPGCGGGGAGGSTTTNATLARPGNGGDGFVIMAAF